MQLLARSLPTHALRHATAAALALGWWAGAASADVVLTRTERIEGAALLKPGAIQIDGRTVPWEDVLYFLRTHAPATLTTPSAVRLKNGECWRADLTGFVGEKLRIQSPVFGRHAIDAGLIAAMDFVHGLGEPAGLQASTLYPKSGEAVPGRLLYIDNEIVALNSPLGALTLRRDALLRYSFAAAAAPDTGPDEIGLRDGSLLRGRLEAPAEGLALDHPVLGSLCVPAGPVRFVVRQAPDWQPVVAFPRSGVDSAPLLGAAPPPLPSPPAERPDFPHVRAFEIQPDTTVSLSVPGAAEAARVFRATVAPARNARGPVHFRVRAGEEVLFDDTIAPDAAPQFQSWPLAQASQLKLEVAFEKPVRFPCGIVLGDPHFVTVKQ